VVVLMGAADVVRVFLVERIALFRAFIDRLISALSGVNKRTV